MAALEEETEIQSYGFPTECRIIDIDSKNYSAISFKYFEPLAEDVTAEYDEVAVRGRSEPHCFYHQTSADMYNFNIRLVASVDENDTTDTSSIYSDYLFLKSLQYPDYGRSYSGPVKPPHKVSIVIGDFFRKKGLIKNPRFSFLSPYDSSGYPHIIDCSFSFRVINTKPLSYIDVRAGK